MRTNPSRIHWCTLLVCGLLLRVPAANAQPDWTQRTVISLGANLHLHYGKGQHFPGIRLFACAGINAVYRDNVYLAYSLSASLYTKTIGASLHPLTNDIQLDVTNFLGAGGTWGDNLSYEKYFRTFTNGAYYNIISGKPNLVMIGTNFVLNNHHRHQMVGSLSVSTQSFTVNYYNDGAPPISWFAGGDEFDRWWTGGLGVFIHTNENYNLLEAYFEQFTGYSHQLYEMSNLLGIDVPQYVRKKNDHPSFNTATYMVRFFPTRGLAIDAGIMGSLRTKNDRAFGLQEMIHMSRHFAVHPNHDINRFYLGGAYNYSYE